MNKERINIFDLSKYFENDSELYSCIERAFYDLYRYDKYLIEIDPNNINIDMETVNEKLGKHYVGERSIVFRYAHYLQNELYKSKKYSVYNLDCEYNRNGFQIKSTEHFPNGTFPDLILHKRGKNGPGNNILIMEFKTYWNPNTDTDSLKISDYVDQNGKYKYQYGLVVLIRKTLDETEFEVYKQSE